MVGPKTLGFIAGGSLMLLGMSLLRLILGDRH